jgi:5-methylcytosine-specific restriction endonuclease McrA
MEYWKDPPARLRGHALYELYEHVFDRDNYTCQECGSNQLDKAPHHIVFKSQGGEDAPENLITLCIVCHGKKHGINYVLKSEL